MIRRRWIAAPLVALLLSIPAAAADGQVAVLFPPDLTLTSEARIAIYAFRGGEGEDPVAVTVNGQEADPLEGEAFLSGEASLGPGMNLLDIGGVTVRVYSLPGTKMERFRLPSEKPDEPLVFRSFLLHPALEDGCEGCHSVEDGNLATMDLKEACYGCHDDFEAKEEGETKHVHDPVASGECTECHDPHYAALPKLQKLEKGCLECHDAFPDEGSVHRPVKDRACTGCHSPHAGPAPKQLLRAGNALCLGCHENPHVQHRSAEVKGGMTQVPDDFPTEKGDLACLGCHVPHQSAERRLFRLPQGKLCQTCHPV